MVAEWYHDVSDDIRQLSSFSLFSVLQPRPRSGSELKRLTSCRRESSPGDHFCSCVFVALELNEKDDFITDMPGVFTRRNYDDHKCVIVTEKEGISRLSRDHPKAE